MADDDFVRPNYYEYIRTPEWRLKANAAKERVQWRCQVCNRHKSSVQLNAHHRTYDRLGREWPEDLTVLCSDCHELYHDAGYLPDPPDSPPPDPPDSVVQSTPARRGGGKGCAAAALGTVLVVASLAIVAIFGGWTPSLSPGSALVPVPSTEPVSVVAPIASVTEEATEAVTPFGPSQCETEGPAAVRAAPVFGALTSLISEGRKVSLQAKTVCGEEIWYELSGGGWVSVADVRCEREGLPDEACPGGAALEANKPNDCVLATDASTRYGPSAEFDADESLKLGDEVTVNGEHSACAGTSWVRINDGRWLPRHVLYCPAGIDVVAIEFTCPPVEWPSQFGELAFCSPEDFDAEEGQCRAATEVFHGETPKVFVSWVPSAASVGAEFRKDWYLDGVEFLASESENHFGYVEVATRESLKPGAYEVRLYVGDELVQTGAFLIAEYSRSFCTLTIRHVWFA